MKSLSPSDPYYNDFVQYLIDIASDRKETLMNTPDISTRDVTRPIPMPVYRAMGSPTRRWTDEDKATMIAMAALGYSQRDVAERLGRSALAVGVYASGHDISFVAIRKAAKEVE